MTLDQIDRLVRRANPVPNLTALEPLDAPVLIEQRRTEMQTHDRVIIDDEGGEPTQGRNLLIGIAAAAAIILGALLLLRPLTSDEPVADDQPATSMQIATEFLTAIASRNADRAISLLSTEALSELGGIETLRSEFRWQEASGFELLPGTCQEAGSTPTETFVECPYDYHGIRSAEQGLGPYTGSRFLLTIRDGVIVLVRDLIVFTENGFADQMWEPFASWLAQNYEVDGPSMYANWPSIGMQAITEESIVLWEERSREYVEVSKAVEVATAFVEAYAAFDIDGAASYLSSDADLWVSDLEKLRLENRVLEAHGFQLLLDSCEQRDVPSDEIVVYCLWDFHAIHSDETGLGPFSGSWFRLTIQEGQVVAATMHWGTDEFSVQAWDPFANWVAENFPEDASAMYTTFYTNYRLSEESVALWEQRSREYAEFVNGS